MIFNQGFLWFSGLLSFWSCFSRSLRNLEDQNLSAHSVTSASTAACRTSCVGNRKLAPRQQFHLMYKKILPKPSSRQTSPFFFLQRSDAPYRSARAFRAGLPGLPASFEAQPPKASSTNGPQITVVPVSNACMQNLLFLLLQAFHVKGADFSLIPSPHHLRGRLVPRCFPLIFIDCLDLVGSWVSFVGFLENLSCASGSGRPHSPDSPSRQAPSSPNLPLPHELAPPLAWEILGTSVCHSPELWPVSWSMLISMSKNQQHLNRKTSWQYS